MDPKLVHIESSQNPMYLYLKPWLLFTVKQPGIVGIFGFGNFRFYVLLHRSVMLLIVSRTDLYHHITFIRTFVYKSPNECLICNLIIFIQCATMSCATYL